MKITAEAWKQVEPLLTAGLDMAPAERATWLEQLRSSRPDQHELLARLFARHDLAERDGAMETVPRLADPPASRFIPEDRIGPFRLLRLLGRGGMGEVWLAEQADGRIARQVALKLPTVVEAGDLRGERFARERDILARLAHPHIARLYDAGIADSGQPWLAMEYIEGEALDKYASRRSLPVAARIGLMRQVLDAVGHAHRHLVVHRDLKPANILVDAAGQVHLLDFGIAKLLADETTPGVQRDLTQLGGRVMTLRYAAPEQVSAGEITTATDVYALGVILHELATGLSPYRALRDGKAFTELALLQEDIASPSSLAPVSRDLDAIILKALRRDPAQRYASVQLFDDDLQRHLESRPVLARAGSWRYLAGRFVRRYRLPIATVATLVLTLAVGLVVAERERRVAVAERERAERHFASVRKLANRMIVDVHGALENVQGSLKARETLIQTSLEYLDSLLAESGREPDLMFELAGAYLRIGRLQGELAGQSLGNTTAAQANFEKGKRLFTALDPLRPNDVAILHEHTTLSLHLARLYYVRGDARWRPELEAAGRLAERAAAAPAATARERAYLGLVLAEQATFKAQDEGKITPEIEAAMARAVAMQEAAVREAPDDLVARRRLAQAHQRAGSMYNDTTRTPETMRRALHHLQRSIDVRKSLVDETKPLTTLWELEPLRDLGLALSAAGRHAEARHAIDECIQRLTKLRDIDPDNVDIVVARLQAHTNAALVAHRAGDVGRTIAHGREVLASLPSLPETMRQTRDPVVASKKAKAYLGFGLYAAAQDTRLDRSKRLALLNEARLLLADAHAFLLHVLANKLGTYDEGDGREIGDTLRRATEEIARLGGPA